MRIQQVDKISDANTYLKRFDLWANEPYNYLNAKIIDVFIGISDKYVSYAIYQSRFGTYPKHDFNPDLSDLHIWAVFDTPNQEDTMCKVGHMIADPYLANLLIKTPI